MTLGEKVILFIEKFCMVPEGALVGQPLVLAEFQKKFIRDIFDNPAGTRRALLSLGRKNGKSSLVSAITLAAIVGPLAKQNSQIAAAAMSREQAGIIFQSAAKMVQLSPVLSKIVRIIPSGKRLIGLPLNVEFKALASDGRTAMGGSYALILIDELGQIKGPQSDFIDALTSSQGAHENPLLIAISTRASNAADLFEQWITDAKTSGDKTIVSHVYSAPDGCDLMDESAWYAANPGLGIFRSMSDLREQLTQAARMPAMQSSARNLLLNQVVSTVNPFISPDVWRENAGAVLPFASDTPVFGGLDLSGKTDLSALVLVGKVAGIWQVVCHAWTPEQNIDLRSKRDRAPYSTWHRQGYLHSTPGATIDYEFVAADMAAICAGLNIVSISFDRWRYDLLQKELTKIGCDLPLIPMGQGFKDQSICLDTLEAELLNKRVAHGGHPVLTMCAANAVIERDAAGGRKLSKHKATGRIDAMAALANAFGGIAKSIESEPVYASGQFSFV